MNEKKVREAIELIRMEISTLEGNENCGRIIEARKKKHIALYNIAIKALEKQLPKKVDVWANGTEHCPVCDKDLTYTGLHICPECYQRLCYTE